MSRTDDDLRERLDRWCKSYFGEPPPYLDTVSISRSKVVPTLTVGDLAKIVETLKAGEVADRLKIVPVRSLVPRPLFEKDTFSGGYNNTIRERNEQRQRDWINENLGRVVLNKAERSIYVPEPAMSAFFEALEKAGARRATPQQVEGLLAWVPGVRR